MTFFARYGEGLVPVMNNIDNLYRLQRNDGFLGMAYNIDSETLTYGERINPPLLAWVEFQYWRFSGDDSRISSVLPRLVRLFDWIKAHRRRKSGLYWFEDSGSSGMDNSPRSGYNAEYLNGSDVCHVDLAAQQALSAECIARLARHLGDYSLAEKFDQEHAEITGLLNRYHWDSKTGFYYDVFHRSEPTDRHNFLNHKTAASFWPMVAGCCRDEQVKSLLEHLTNPEEFWTKHPVASLSKDDPNFDPTGGYWLGGVWAPMNYMLTNGLKRCGRPDLARKLALAHLEAMQAVYESSDYPGIWESYAPEDFRPATKKAIVNEASQPSAVLNPETVVRKDFVGWSGLGPIAMLIENVVGLDFDAPDRCVSWDVSLTGRHGIEGLQFAGAPLSMMISGTHAGERELSVECEQALTLKLFTGGVALGEFTVQPGQNSWKFKS